MLRRGVLKQFLSTFISLLIVSDLPRRIRFFLRITISRWQKSIQRQFKLFKVVRNHAGSEIQRSKDHRNIVVTNFYLTKIFHLIHPQFVVTDTPKWRHFFEKSNIIGHRRRSEIFRVFEKLFQFSNFLLKDTLVIEWRKNKLRKHFRSPQVLAKDP